MILALHLSLKLIKLRRTLVAKRFVAPVTWMASEELQEKVRKDKGRAKSEA